MLNKNQNGFLFLASAVLLFSVELPAQTQSLQDIARASDLPAKVMIYTAKKIITLDEKHPSATAIAIVGDRILAAGSLGQLKKQLGDQPFSVDDRFAGKTIVPGFIAQHDHPLLTGLTMSSEIIAIEDWVLPDKTVPAAKNREDYLRRLTSAESRLSSPDEPLLTWGFHHYFFGKLTRADLDKISQVRPIIVWHRSCHEFILNTAAMELERVRTMNGMELRRLRSKSKSAFFGSKITAPNSPSTPAGQVAVSCVCGSPFLHILSQNLQSRPVESERR
jgi:hypothetical protein